MSGIVFINYRRRDAEHVAGRLFDRLEQDFSQDQLFIDVDNIPPGEDFVAYLDRKVEACDVFLALVGPNWQPQLDKRNYEGDARTKDFVRIEIESALAKDKKVIPILVGGAEMPREEDLPEGLRPFSRRNAMRLSHERFRADAAGITNAVKVALAEAEGHKPISAPTGTQSEPSKVSAPENEIGTRRSYLIAAVLCVLLLIGAGAVYRLGLVSRGSSVTPQAPPDTQADVQATAAPPTSPASAPSSPAATETLPEINPPMSDAATPSPSPATPEKAEVKTAAVLLGMQTAATEGVVGQLWGDQSKTARICRKNGTCIPGEGSDIEIGDTIDAPNLAVLDIEDPGGFSRHGLTGKIADTQLVKLDDGKLALELALSQGKMEGTIRELAHVIRIGSVYCLAKDADYVAEATQTRGLFEIERGSGLCYQGTRKVEVDAGNPRFEWAFQ